MSTQTTRRAVLAGSAAVAATPLAGQSAIATAHPDALLLQLGAQFDGLVAALAEAEVRWQPRHETFERELAKLETTSADFRAAFDEALRRADAAHNIAMPGPDDITNMMDAPSREIMSLPAMTLAGLAVKARLAKFACSHFWREKFEDTDWDKKCARDLIDAVLDQAGKAVRS